MKDFIRLDDDGQAESWRFPPSPKIELTRVGSDGKVEYWYANIPQNDAVLSRLDTIIERLEEIRDQGKRRPVV